MGTFQSFWHGNGLPPYQQLALKSFIDHGHRFVLFTYADVKVPAGVELADAAAILPQERIFLNRPAGSVGTVAAFSDLFRFHLLHKRGGWWVDTDVVCLSKDVPERDIYLGWQDHRLVGTAIMRFPAGGAVTAELCQEAERLGTNIRFGDIGPGLLTRVVKERGLADALLPQTQIYPLAPHQALDVLLPSKTEDVRAMVKNAPLLHLWNEIFSRAAILGWVAPPPGCFIRELFRRHGFPVSERYCYTAEQVAQANGNLLRSMDATTQFNRAKALEAEAADLRRKLAEAETSLAALRARAGG